MTRKSPRSIERLMNSALAAEAMMGPDFEWARLLKSKRPRPPAAAFVSPAASPRNRSYTTWCANCGWLGCSGNAAQAPLTIRANA